jgi:hypothetical protein
MATPSARRVWKPLVEAYVHTAATAHPRVKEALAAAIAGAADESVLNDIVALAKDSRNGSSRVLLLRALRLSRSSIAKQGLEDLSYDPQLATEIFSWGKMKAMRRKKNRPN